MARAVRHFAWDNDKVLPSYQTSNRFCYFLDLYLSSQGLSTSLARHKR
mgnify:CR=1 FL=1